MRTLIGMILSLLLLPAGPAVSARHPECRDAIRTWRHAMTRAIRDCRAHGLPTTTTTSSTTTTTLRFFANGSENCPGVACTYLTVPWADAPALFCAFPAALACQPPPSLHCVP